jgi:hydroxyacylglutathione hydrolase
VDIRDPEQFAKGHAPGSLNIPVSFKSFVTWCGWLLDYGEDIHLIAETEEQAQRAVARMSLIGLDRVSAWSPTEVIERLPSIDSYREGSFERGDDAGQLLLDVRSQSEWDEGHIDGSVHIPLGYLPDRLSELPKDRPIAVYCQGGGRSPIGASVLQAGGFRDIVDLLDGFDGYVRLRRERALPR